MSSAPEHDGAAGEPARIGRAEGKDPELVLAATAWRGEPELMDEPRAAARGNPGWHRWNNMSPELEFCELAALLVQFLRPKTVIETGTGQGFTTRRIAARLAEGQRLVCFEANPLWRQALGSTSFFRDSTSCSLSENGGPTAPDLKVAELSVLDSGFPLRRKELRRWRKHAPPGAVVLVHDTGNGHPLSTPHMKLRKLIIDLGIPGVFLKNPRGAFLGFKLGHDAKGAEPGGDV